MKIKKINGNPIIVILLIISLSCQSIPPASNDEPVNPITVIRENLPPDEDTIEELQKASDLARSYRQQLVSSGMPNFSFNDWQIASLLYDQTIQMERSSTLRETQESIARYNLTAIILETLYLSATNDMPIGGGVVYYDGDDMYWDFAENGILASVAVREQTDEPAPAEKETQTAVLQAEEPAAVPQAPIITVPAAQIPVQEEPARTVRRTARREEPGLELITEVTRQPGMGMFIPDAPSREEVKSELITAAIEAGEYIPPPPAVTDTRDGFFTVEETSSIQPRIPVPPVTPAPMPQIPVTPPPVTPAPETQVQAAQSASVTQAQVIETLSPETQVQVASVTQAQVIETPSPETQVQAAQTASETLVLAAQIQEERPASETAPAAQIQEERPASETAPAAQIQEEMPALETVPSLQIQETQPASETAPAAQIQETQPPVVTQMPVIRSSIRYPAQYRVISWELYGDCLWNIAGIVYNDPRKWRIIFEANKHIMPDPDNPDLIVPDMILTIPSIEGESREGLWDGSMGRPGY